MHKNVLHLQPSNKMNCMTQLLLDSKVGAQKCKANKFKTKRITRERFTACKVTRVTLPLSVLFKNGRQTSKNTCHRVKPFYSRDGWTHPPSNIDTVKHSPTKFLKLIHNDPQKENKANIVHIIITMYTGAAPASGGGEGGGGFGRPAGPRQLASQPPSQPSSQPPLLCTCMFALPPLLSRSQDDVTDPWSVW